tara:strand:+ start:1531 stop:2442 length:912 start_codon:yes stop_codon:yes gene_type:complete
MYNQPSKSKKLKKYLIFHINGGLGKNVAATALIPGLKKQYPGRKLIMVVSWPEVFLNHPDIDKVYSLGNHPHFYENYIENKDVIVFKHEPYDQTGHITKQKHLIENWCDLLGLEYTKQIPYFPINYAQNKLQLKWIREKPILLLQTTGGPFISPEGPPKPYAWTRDLPIEIAQTIVNKYSQDYHIIQVTKDGGYGLQDVERLDKPLSNLELFSLVAASQKRFLIDSSLQHAAAAFRMPSTVFWVGTSPKVFGYDMHTNIVSKLHKKANQLINSYMFDFNFDNNEHECPYMSINEMFDIENLDI